MTRPAARGGFLLLLLLVGSGCPSPQPPPLPDPDLDLVEPQVLAALEEARERVRQRPELAARWGELGALYDVHGLYGPAEAAYRRARALEPGEFRWAYFLAVVRDVNGAEVGELRPLFDAAIALRSDYAPAYFRLGHALSLRGELPAAEQALRRALEIDPRLALAQRELGQLLLAAERPDEALPRLIEAARLQPRDGAIFATLAQLYQRRGEQAQAQQMVERSRQLTPLNELPDPVHAEFVGARGVSAVRWIERARRLLDGGQFAEAIGVLNELRRIRPDDPDVYYQLGTAHARQGDATAAERELARALELDPDHVWARLERGRSYEEAGRLDEALVELRRAEAVAPDEPQLLAALTQLLAKRGETAAVLEVFQRLERVSSLDARLLVNWGNACVRNGAPAEAIPRYLAALELQPDYVNAHFNLALALERQGDRAAALSHYEAVLRLEPNHVAAAENARRLRRG